MKTRRVLFISLPVILFIPAWIYLLPRNYDVLQFRSRPGTQYWELNTGSKIGYSKITARGDSLKAPIIYLHGGPGGMIKDEVIETLKPLAGQGHELYFYDQIGSGHSARLKDIGEYTVQRHREDLAAIVDKIGAEKVILIGHSWGCLLAVNYLQNYPQKVERLLLEGPGPILPINRQYLKRKAPDSLHLISPEYSNAAGNQNAYNPRSRLVLKWANLFEQKLASDREMDAFFTHLNTELNKSTGCTIADAPKTSPGGGGYYAHIMTVKSFNEVPNKKDRMPSINTPILILRGQCDNQPWGYTQEYLDLFPNIRLQIIENCGHDLIHGDREVYLAHLKAFLE